MDGLTNIIAKINEQTDIECSDILALAKEKADEIVAKAKEDAEKLCADISAKTESKLSVIKSKAVSSSELEYKRVILSKKSEILDACLESALNEIAKLSADEYFSYIEKLLLKGACEGEGKVFFNAKDKERLPEGFIRNIAEKFALPRHRHRRQGSETCR